MELRGHHFRAFIETSPIGFGLASPDGQVLYANPALWRIAGLEADRFDYAALMERFHPDDNDQVRAFIRHAALTGEAGDIDFRFQHPDGTTVWVLAHVAHVAGDDPSKKNRAWTFVDISDEMRVRDLARQMTGFYATLSRLNGAIPHCADDGQLYATLCKILVEEGGFPCAAVACADWAARRATFAVCAGPLPLTNHIIEFDLASPEYSSLLKQALLTGDAQFSDDIAHDPRIGARVREAYAATKVQSVGVAVIRCRGEVVAALLIASSEAEFFTAEIKHLIEGIGAEASFALDAVAREHDLLAALAALKDGAQLYSTLVDCAPVGIFQTGAEGTMIFANDTLLELAGLRRDEIESHARWVEAYHPDDRDTVETAWVEAARTLSATEAVTYRYIRGDGSITWAHARAVPLLDDDGRLKGYVGVVTDITEERQHRRQIEQLSRLYATQSRVNAIVATATDETELLEAICRVVVDTGEFEQAAVTRIDWERRRTIQLFNFGEIATPTPYRERDLDDPECFSVTNAATRNGETAFVNDYQNDDRIPPRLRAAAAAASMHSAAAVPLRRNGKIIATISFVSREIGFFTPEIVALIDEIGQSVSFALDSLEQAEQKRRAEEALRRSERLYATLVDAAPVGILQSDRDGRIVFTNPAMRRMSGHGAETMSMESLLARLPPEDAARTAKLWHDMQLNQECVLHTQFRYRHDDARIVWAHAEAVPLYSDNDEFDGYVVIATDVTAETGHRLRAEKMARLYATLSRVNSIIVQGASDEDSLLHTICHAIVDIGGFDVAVATRVDWATRTLRCVVEAGIPRPSGLNLEVPSLDADEQDSLSRIAALEGRTIISNDYAADLRLSSSYRDITQTGRPVGSAICVPLRREGQIVGTLSFTARERNAFTGEVLALVEEIGGDVSFALDNLHRSEEKRLADLALHRSEQRYVSLVDMLPVGVFETDIDGTAYFLNDTQAALSGLGKGLVSLAKWVEAIHPDDRDFVITAWREATAREVPFAFKFRYSHRDGHSVWAQASMVPRLAEDGQLLGFAGTLNDITREQEQLRKIERLSRYNAAHSRINTAIVHGATATALLEELCHAATESGAFDGAVTFLINQAAHQASIVESRVPGREAAELEGVSVGIADGDAWTLIHDAIRTGAIAGTPNLQEEPRIDPSWRQVSRELGLTGCCAVPLKCFGDTVAMLVLFTPEQEYLDAEIFALIEEIGRDVSFALDNLRHAEEKRLAEAAVARSEQHLNVTLRSIGDAVLVTDTEGRVTLMNPVAEMLTGWREDEARGRPVSEVFRIVNQDTREPVVNPVSLVLRDGNVVGLANHTVLIAKNGSERPIADSGAPIRQGEDGRIQGVVLVFRDQTEEYRMQKALKDSEQLYSTLVKTLPIGVFRSDPAGNPFLGNETMKRIAGTERDTLPVDESVRRIHPDDREGMFAAFAAAARNSEVFSMRYRYLHEDGEVIWASTHAAPILDAEGRVSGYVGAVVDVTLEHAQHERLDQISHLNQTLRRVNSAIAYCENEAALFDKICEVFSGPGEFSAAAVYTVDRRTQRADILIYHGGDAEVMREFGASLPLGQNELWTLVAHAANTGTTGISDNFRDDARFPLVLREGSRQYAMLSGCALPLLRGGEPCAVLMLYSTEVGYFRAEIVALLEEIRRDLSHALEALANGEQRAAAERALAHSEERLRLGLSLTDTGMYEANYEENRIRLDEVAARLMDLGDGAVDDDLDRFSDWLAEDGHGGIKAHDVTEEIHAGGRERFDSVFPVTLPDGALRWLRSRGALTSERTPQGQPVRLLGVMTDVTVQKSLEERNRIAASVFDTSGEAILIADADMTIQMANAAFTRMSGFTADDVLGRRLSSPHRSDLHDESFYAEAFAQLHRLGVWQGEIWRKRKDGEVYPVLATLSLVKDAAGRIAQYVAQEIDISSQKEFEQRISRLAYRDPLTDLPNRALLRDRVEQGIAAARREESTLALLFLDLDHFKNINDSLGHAVGDHLLEEIARRLTDSTREVDTVGRLGGDEFLVLLPGSDADAAAHVAEKLLAACAHPILVESRTLAITPSIGIALYPKDGGDYHELLKSADTAMYRAKDLGRNTYRFYAPEMNQVVFQRLMLESSLRIAAERGEFILHYQPKFELSTRALVGAEALIRWHHPEMGVISPAQFIPIAEESGLIELIGRWVLEEACRQIKAWIDEGLPPLRVAVNFSARQFAARNIVETVTRALEKTGLPGSSLEMEITESLLAQDMDYTLDALKQLKKLGVYIAVDDFGTGYSSLSYLKRFPIDRLKIDQSFVRDLGVDADDRAIATAIVTMGHSLGMRVIAEGVETEEQMGILLSLGCDEVQGYFTGRPQPAHETTLLLRNLLAATSARAS